MGEPSNFYEKCSSLSKKGDVKSLRTLLQMGFSGNKTARVALRKTRNKKLLKSLIDEYLNNIPSEYNADMILNLAVRVLRKEYLYVYLMESFREKKDLKEIGFFKSIKDNPLNNQEQVELKKYIIDAKDFDIRLISLVAVEERDEILYALLTKAMDEGLDTCTTKIFLANKDYLKLIQPEIRKTIEKRAEGTAIFATYLDLKEKENQDCIADFEKMSLIYTAVRDNVWAYGEMNFYHDSISIAFKLCRNEELSSSDWKVIKESINEELLGVRDGNNATKMLFDLLLNLSKYDYSYSEEKLIMIYNRTSLYSSKALEILGKIHSEFAYKEFLKKIIIAEQETECFHTAVRLINFFPEREKAIIEYIKILDDSRLIDVIHEKAQKALANKNKTVDKSVEKIPFAGKRCSVLSNNIVLNELLIKLGEEIKATRFFAAVGFSFSSGLRLVKPLMDQIRSNNGKIELVVGSLQTYGFSRKNTKIDRNSIIALNTFRNEYPLTLYTYQNSFYHGKFYYIANDNKAYVIIGSSNISKTAYLNNYELDLLFEIDCNNPEEQDFINWFEKFKSECIKIEELNPEEYDTLDWDSELDVYESRTIDRMSQDDVRNKITELTDEDTKFRLNAWLEHDPAEIFSNIGVPSLQEYIVFLYPGFGLAVFESFVPGNAYYAFRYTEFEKLLNQVSTLTKTQMLMNSAFLNRGYHLQDSVKTKEKINLLFAQK
ncbi:hypothetical protein DXB23_13950 [Dorea sp. OM02-2LB]|nr:hypothetical protein DXB23_13950 [Dorea sp. OM02-2LB]